MTATFFKVYSDGYDSVECRLDRARALVQIMHSLAASAGDPPPNDSLSTLFEMIETELDVAMETLNGYLKDACAREGDNLDAARQYEVGFADGWRNCLRELHGPKTCSPVEEGLLRTLLAELRAVRARDAEAASAAAPAA